MDKKEIIRKVIDKRVVFFNVRESRLEYMLHRKLITPLEYEAGSRYRRLCEIAQIGGRAAKLEPKVDGDNSDVMGSKIGAMMFLAKIDKHICKPHDKIMKLFCWENYGVMELSINLGISQRKSSGLVHEGLSRLCIFFGYKKTYNTIKGHNVSKKQKIQIK
jgi:hypothetical protein|tara:strand:- start:391 stop:873 length:483 start_codon:yes stop_codon:yes gene_type:complete